MVPGRKTAVLDSEWLAQLLEFGLLRRSFVPPAAQRELRDLVRYRKRLIEERAREANRVQKVLETANIKLDPQLPIWSSARDAAALAGSGRGAWRAHCTCGGGTGGLRRWGGDATPVVVQLIRGSSGAC